MTDHQEDVPKELVALYEKKRALLTLPENATHRQIENAYHQRSTGRYLGDLIFGANDGLITTFAVVAGAAGAGLSASIVLILGFANLFGDGLSMGLGNFLGKKSELAYQKNQRVKENWEIDHLREIEVQEIRDIFSRWGFAGADLERAVMIVSQNRAAWIDIMMKEELGIIEDDDEHPGKHGAVTFFSFAGAALIPLLPFVFGVGSNLAYGISISLTALTLFFVGAYRSRLSALSFWKSGLEMLFVGSIAAGAAYLIGDILARSVQ
jgi:VIT1/CCC1 family predicted Fe2+/Mn2+ transporter